MFSRFSLLLLDCMHPVMLQATRRTGEQGLLKLSQHQLRTALSLSRTSNGLNGFIAPALLRAGARSRNISVPASRSSRNNEGYYSYVAMQQLRFQSTETQRESSRGGAAQMPPDLAARREKEKTTPTSSSKTTSTQSDRDGVASEKTEETKASSSSKTVTSEKPSSKEASTSSSSVAKPKDPLMTRVWAKVKHEASHYWSGTKLLGKEIKISSRLQMKLLRGKTLTRREKRQVRHNKQYVQQYNLR